MKSLHRAVKDDRWLLGSPLLAYFSKCYISMFCGMGVFRIEKDGKLCVIYVSWLALYLFWFMFEFFFGKDDMFCKSWFSIGSFSDIFWESMECVGLLFWNLMRGEVNGVIVDEGINL